MFGFRRSGGKVSGSAIKKTFAEGTSSTPDYKVSAFNSSAIRKELIWKLTKKKDWELIKAGMIGVKVRDFVVKTEYSQE
jgi:hypothetical protein